MANDISILSLFLAALMFLIPIGFSFYFKLFMTKDIIISGIRMFVQLFLVGVFLKYIFQLDNFMLNILWLFLMLIVAAFSILSNIEFNKKLFLPPIIASLFLVVAFVGIYFNYFIIGLKDIFQAKYFIPIGGMLLGNSLKGNIIGLDNFYKNISKQEKKYFYKLSLGATRYEALLPFIRKSIKISSKPTLATMATIGIVSLPGMMTGQILSGESPMNAIKYQIAITIAILVTRMLGIVLTLLFTIPIAFDEYGVLKKDVFGN
ncbi:ABC transporter permease [Haliovirga abyssi]|uniref:ABC transporter permease n=1 Tax=Haliovirga abyssi TaxID=2996794 RepID=A0AAU9D6K1_9FUSO|nr:ABC transporter permease [Haliovirga abyssi]BDU50178.1 ABC transporter permease [Haliovirga abyssi]